MANIKSERPRHILFFILLLLGLLITVYPFLYMLMNSFKTGMEIMHYPNRLPTKISLEGYRQVFVVLDLFTLFRNSLFVSGMLTVLNCLFNAMVAYALTKLHFRGRELIFKLILFTIMIPSVLLLIPTYSMMYRIGWVDTYWVLILPGMVSAYNIFLVRQFFTQIDDAYIEAAKIDGANHMRIFFTIVVPMSKAVLSTVGIMVFMGSWNDLFNPMMYLRSERLYTLQLGLLRFESRIPGEHVEQLWSGLVISTLPVVIAYFMFQRNFVKAFTGVGLK